MNAAAIKRGGAMRRKPVRRATKTKPSWVSVTLKTLPLSAQIIERIVTWFIVAVVSGGLIAIALMLDVPHRIGMVAGETIGRAGFQVRQIDITGINRMDRQSVYAVALDQRSIAMPLVDLEGVRQRLLQYGWVADARVSRRLPDTLAIQIVERKPAAVWQHAQRLTLVDAAGVALEPVEVNAMPALPRVIGPDANAQSPALTRLMTVAPRMNAVLDSAVWVGGRRWDLKFQSGETLMLPEGEVRAAAALRRFAELDTAQRLLGQDMIYFDLRNPAQMAILPRAKARPSTAPAGPATKPLNPALST